MLNFCSVCFADILKCENTSQNIDFDLKINAAFLRKPQSLIKEDIEKKNPQRIMHMPAYVCVCVCAVRGTIRVRAGLPVTDKLKASTALHTYTHSRH